MSLIRSSVHRVRNWRAGMTISVVVLLAASASAEMDTVSVACSKDTTPAIIADVARVAALEQGIPISRYRLHSVRFDFTSLEWDVSFFRVMGTQIKQIPLCIYAHIDADAKVKDLHTCPLYE